MVSKYGDSVINDVMDSSPVTSFQSRECVARTIMKKTLCIIRIYFNASEKRESKMLK